MSVEIEVEGLKELNRALKQLPGKIANKVIRQATASGAVVIRKEARAKAPVDTGNLRKNIAYKTKLDRKNGGAVAEIGVKEEAFYGTILEVGTSNIPAHPFLRPALDEKREEAMRAIQDRLRVGIEKETAKLRTRI